MLSLDISFRALDRLKGKRAAAQEQVAAAKAEIRALLQEQKAAEQAVVLTQQVARETQKHLEFKVSALSTMALTSVLDRDISLSLEFSEKRGKTEAEFAIIEEGMSLPPEDHVGGGVIDLLGLSLRFSIWSIMAQRTAPIFFLDEPLKWLKGGGMPEKGQELISQIAQQLGVQIIMVSHAPELIVGADHTVVVE